MRKATTRIIAGALSAALVLTGVNMPNKSASAASAKLNKDRVVLYVGGNNTTTIKAKNVDSVKFKSKDESVAKVNKKTGKVTAKGAGKTKVIAKTNEGKLKCKVRVYKSIKTLTPDTEEVTLAPGETQTVAVSVKPAKAQAKMWKVTTSDKTVATKTKANGKKGTFDINAVAEGEATITISSTDGGSAADATVKVNVVAAEEDLETDVNDEDIKDTPEQEDITILSKTALTNADKNEAYIWYASYDADGSEIENPAIGWNVTDYAPNSTGDTTKYAAENIRELGCLIVSAEDESTFSEGDLISVYIKSMNSEASVLEDVVIGEVREITDITFAGIMETDSSGNTTNIGDTLPFGFEGNGNTYQLAFNLIDQDGHVFVHAEVADYGVAPYPKADGVFFYNTFSTGDWTNYDTTPAQIVEPSVVDYAAVPLEERTIDDTYVDLIDIKETENSAVGGSAFFMFVTTAYNFLDAFEYTVGTTSDLTALQIDEQSGVICDGDEDVTFGITGIYADGTEYPSIPVAALTAAVGSNAVAALAASASTQVGDPSCTVLYNAESASITWTDSIELNPSSDDEDNVTIVYNADCFDAKDRTITLSLTNVPDGIESNSVTLTVSDPRRPVDVVETDWTASNEFSIDNEGDVICFVDQYGEKMSNDILTAFYKQATTDGFNVVSENVKTQTYYGIAAVGVSGTYIASGVGGNQVSFESGESEFSGEVFVFEYKGNLDDGTDETALDRLETSGKAIGSGVKIGTAGTVTLIKTDAYSPVSASGTLSITLVGGQTSSASGVITFYDNAGNTCKLSLDNSSITCNLDNDDWSETVVGDAVKLIYTQSDALSDNGNDWGTAGPRITFTFLVTDIENAAGEGPVVGEVGLESITYEG